jgi:hypothetical protein
VWSPLDDAVATRIRTWLAAPSGKETRP